MSACEICWAEASRKALMLGGMTGERYRAELDAHPEPGSAVEGGGDHERDVSG